MPPGGVTVKVKVLIRKEDEYWQFVEMSPFLVSLAVCVYFVQNTYILDANCEGQSDSQSNGHRAGLLDLEITYVI